VIVDNNQIYENSTQLLIEDEIEEIEIIVEQDELNLYWEIDPGVEMGNLINLSSLDQTIDRVVSMSKLARSKSKVDEREETLLFYYRGDHFGEASLLASQPHSGTVEGKRDGLLLKLDAADFLKLFHEIPAISLHVSRSLGHRLTQSEGESVRREVKIVALYGQSNSPETFCLWTDFSRHAGECHHNSTRLWPFSLRRLTLVL